MNLRFVVVPTLTSLTLVALGLGALALPTLALPAGRRLLARTLGRHPGAVLAFALVVASVATLGSLYLSEGMGLEPCELCWYQRIAMYPLVVILGVALARGDPSVWKTALPLCAAGFLVSAYHVIIQYRPSLDIVTCSTTAPCTLRYLQAYGFVSIPVMAGAAFVLVASALAIHGGLGRPGEA